MKKIIRNFVLAVLSLCFVMNTAAFASVNEPTGIQAESAILVEKESGTVIYEKNADRKMYPASMTKILTSLLLLDYYSPDDVPLSFQNCNIALIGDGKGGWTWSAEGDNHGRTKKIFDKWYYFEASF